MNSPRPVKIVAIALMQLGLLLTSVFLLQAINLFQMSGLALGAVLFVIAVPLAVYQLEFPLFHLRAGLEAATREGSTVRALLWWGNLRKLVAFASSLLGAWLILILCHDLHHFYWIALYFEAVVLVVVFNLSNYRWLTDETTDRHRGLFARKFSHYVAVIILTLVFVYLGYHWVGVPDLRGETLGEVVQGAFDKNYNQAASWIVGVSLGIVSALSQATWYIVQIVLPGLDDGGYTALGWIFFLLPAAIQAALIIQLHLGLIAMIEWKERNDIFILGRSSSARLFFGVFLTLILASAFIGYQLGNVDIPTEMEKLTDRVQAYDPCEAWSTDVKNFSAGEIAEVKQITETVKTPVTVFIEDRMTGVNLEMDPHIEAYLEWYFSHATQFKIQLLWAYDWVSSFGSEDSDRLDTVASTMQVNVMEHIIGPYRLSLARANKEAAELANKLLHEEFLALEERAKENRRYLSAFQGDLCVSPALLNISAAMAQRDVTSGAAGTGALGSGAVFFTAAVAAKTASKKLAAAIAGKTAGKMATKLGLSLGTKAVSSGSGTFLTGASMGAICGPAAPACAILGGIAAAVVFEIAFNEADEYLSRETARADLETALDAMTKEATLAYIETYDQMIEQSVMRTFHPLFVPAQN